MYSTQNFHLHLTVVIMKLDFNSVPHKLLPLIDWLQVPSLLDLISWFLYQEINPSCDIPLANIPLEFCPQYMGKVYTYPSAITTFYTPSDLSGIGGSLREQIQCAPEWRNGTACHNCVFVCCDPNMPLPDFHRLCVAQVIPEVEA